MGAAVGIVTDDGVSDYSLDVDGFVIVAGVGELPEQVD